MGGGGTIITKLQLLLHLFPLNMMVNFWKADSLNYVLVNITVL